MIVKEIIDKERVLRLRLQLEVGYDSEQHFKEYDKFVSQEVKLI
jgi:hypothetical protein